MTLLYSKTITRALKNNDSPAKELSTNACSLVFNKLKKRYDMFYQDYQCRHHANKNVIPILFK